MPRDSTSSYTPINNTAYPAVNGVTMTSADWNALVADMVTAFNTAYPNAGGTLATMQVASGAAIDFAGIPATAKRITVQFVGVSTTGTSSLMVQVGDSGGIETTGYLGATANLGSGPTVLATGFTTGLGVAAVTATTVIHGTLTLTLVNAATNTWASSGVCATSDAVGTIVAAGSKSLSATLDRIRLTTVGGADTFDAGSVNILYE